MPTGHFSGTIYRIRTEPVIGTFELDESGTPPVFMKLKYTTFLMHKFVDNEVI